MNVYDLIADHYSELFPVEAEKLDFIQHLCPLPGRLCDAGCATGDLALGLHQRGYDIYGLDLNAKMIGIAEQKAAIRSVSAHQENWHSIERTSPIFCNSVPVTAYCVSAIRSRIYLMKQRFAVFSVPCISRYRGTVFLLLKFSITTASLLRKK